MKRTTAILATVLLCCAAFCQQAKKTKYIFLFIGDGMSIPQRTAAEEFFKTKNMPPLAMNKMQYQAITRTPSADKFITDSAASGTAIACGTKTKNYYIGLDPNGNRLQSVAELAKQRGMGVGIITTVSLTHATPAAFYAHTANRYDVVAVGDSLVESGFDFFGGGAVWNTQKTFGNTATSADLEHFNKKAAEGGYKILRTREEINNIKKGDGKTIVSLNVPYAIPYLIDEPDSVRPRLMLEKAIALLEDNPKGFFIMVEGGTVDWMCHVNDAATAFHEVLDLDNAVRVAMKFAEKHPGETLIVVTGDHETGGLTLGFLGTGYDNNMRLLARQNKSQTYLSGQVSKLIRKNHNAQFDDIKGLLSDSFGLKFDKADASDPMYVDEKDLAMLKDAFEDGKRNILNPPKVTKYEDVYLQRQNAIPTRVMHLVNGKAGLAWTSFFHTALPTCTTASGAGAENFKGTIENTDVAKILKEAVGDR